MSKMATESIVSFQTAPEHSSKSKKNALAIHKPAQSWPNVVIGRLTSLEGGQAKVDFPGNNTANPVNALAGVSLSSAEIGREVILAFADGDPEKPIILSFLVKPQTPALPSMEIQADGEKLLVTAQKEIVLRCGEASITLTAAGKVILKGTYVLSRSTGYNKIKGAAVDIN